MARAIPGPCPPPSPPLPHLILLLFCGFVLLFRKPYKNNRPLSQINETRGLGFDDWDLDFYETLFKDKLQRDPTDVELFDMGQVRE